MINSIFSQLRRGYLLKKVLIITKTMPDSIRVLAISDVLLVFFVSSKKRSIVKLAIILFKMTTRWSCLKSSIRTRVLVVVAVNSTKGMAIEHGSLCFKCNK